MSESPGQEIDMSSEAIDRRLHEVSQLNRLCRQLVEAGRQAGLSKPDRADRSPGSG